MRRKKASLRAVLAAFPVPLFSRQAIECLTQEAIDDGEKPGTYILEIWCEMIKTMHQTGVIEYDLDPIEHETEDEKRERLESLELDG